VIEIERRTRRRNEDAAEAVVDAVEVGVTAARVHDPDLLLDVIHVGVVHWMNLDVRSEEMMVAEDDEVDQVIDHRDVVVDTVMALKV